VRLRRDIPRIKKFVLHGEARSAYKGEETEMLINESQDILGPSSSSSSSSP